MTIPPHVASSGKESAARLMNEKVVDAQVDGPLKELQGQRRRLAEMSEHLLDDPSISEEERSQVMNVMLGTEVALSNLNQAGNDFATIFIDTGRWFDFTDRNQILARTGYMENEASRMERSYTQVAQAADRAAGLGDSQNERVQSFAKLADQMSHTAMDSQEQLAEYVFNVHNEALGPYLTATMPDDLGTSMDRDVVAALYHAGSRRAAISHGLVQMDGEGQLQTPQAGDSSLGI